MYVLYEFGIIHCSITIHIFFQMNFRLYYTLLYTLKNYGVQFNLKRTNTQKFYVPYEFGIIKNNCLRLDLISSLFTRTTALLLRVTTYLLKLLSIEILFYVVDWNRDWSSTNFFANSTSTDDSFKNTLSLIIKVGKHLAVVVYTSLCFVSCENISCLGPTKFY